jgi:hypothetical protein
VGARPSGKRRIRLLYLPLGQIRERAMKGMLIGLAVLAAIIGGGFAALLVMAESGAPEASEIRIEVDGDALGGR